MEKITIVLSSDNNYAPYLGVCIQSLISNTSKSNLYNIHILDGGISDANKEKIMQLQIKNAKIFFIDMKSYIQNYTLSIFHTNLHFSIATYYRFFLPTIFPKLDKVIYLDCDTVVLKDIAELYKKDITNYYLAATRDIEIIRAGARLEKKYLDYFYNTLNLKDHTQYFQAGCMLLNLNKMRQEHLTEKLINKLIEIKTPKFVDQCILNSVCQGHICFLDQNWNYTWHLPFIDLQYKDIIPEPYNKWYTEAQKNPYIIHFTGMGMKPWLNPSLEKAEYFWQYARQTPFYEEILYKNLKVSPTQNITQNVTKQITQVTDMSIVKDIANYSKNRFNYYRCKLMANLTFGKMRKHYKEKKRALKAKIKAVRRFLKGK